MITILEINMLHQGDCLKLMKKIADKSVDLILSDLPYGTTACKWDSIIPFEQLWIEYERIIKDNGTFILTASQPFTSALIMSNPKLFKYELIWEKSKASNFVHANFQPLKAHENIVVFSKGGSAQGSKSPMTYNKQMTTGKPFSYIATDISSKEVLSKGGGKGDVKKQSNGERNPRSVLYFKTADSEGKLHPVQKPIALFEYLIKTYSNEGEVVLDNCIGSGTTAIAAINTNRKWIGIEMEEKYVEIANNRINNHIVLSEKQTQDSNV